MFSTINGSLAIQSAKPLKNVFLQSPDGSKEKISSNGKETLRLIFSAFSDGEAEYCVAAKKSDTIHFYEKGRWALVTVNGEKIKININSFRKRFGVHASLIKNYAQLNNGCIDGIVKESLSKVTQEKADQGDQKARQTLELPITVLHPEPLPNTVIEVPIEPAVPVIPIPQKVDVNPDPVNTPDPTNIIETKPPKRRRRKPKQKPPIEPQTNIESKTSIYTAAERLTGILGGGAALAWAGQYLWKQLAPNTEIVIPEKFRHSLFEKVFDGCKIITSPSEPGEVLTASGRCNGWVVNMIAPEVMEATKITFPNGLDRGKNIVCYDTPSYGDEPKDQGITCAGSLKDFYLRPIDYLYATKENGIEDIPEKYDIGHFLEEPAFDWKKYSYVGIAALTSLGLSYIAYQQLRFFITQVYGSNLSKKEKFLEASYVLLPLVGAAATAICSRVALANW